MEFKKVWAIKYSQYTFIVFVLQVWPIPLPESIDIGVGNTF